MPEDIRQPHLLFILKSRYITELQAKVADKGSKPQELILQRRRQIFMPNCNSSVFTRLLADELFFAINEI